MNYEKMKVCLQNMNYEHLCCITWIMNILFKYMNYEKINVCSQCMNYEIFFAIHELLK